MVTDGIEATARSVPIVGQQLWMQEHWNSSSTPETGSKREKERCGEPADNVCRQDVYVRERLKSKDGQSQKDGSDQGHPLRYGQ